LIPAGQLDGGHVTYVLLGKKAALLLPVVLGGLLLLGIFWNGWWIWALLIFTLGRQYAEPLDQITELDTPRKVIAFLAILLFILVFIPVPLLTMG
jgi:membrane-associated protease RseP (regulator of RpoE activity)